MVFHMLGWGADYPDATNFLDFHFGPGASAQFGEGFQDIWDAAAEWIDGSGDCRSAPAFL
jgi:peptide/nickel transport system substrate-binding protein